MQFQISEAIEVLSRTPAVLDAMLGGLSEPWVQNNYGEKMEITNLPEANQFVSKEYREGWKV